MKYALFCVLLVAMFFYARHRAMVLARTVGLPCLPHYYGWYLVLLLCLPVAVFTLCWGFLQDSLVEALTLNALNIEHLSAKQLDALVADGRIFLSGQFTTSAAWQAADPLTQQFVNYYKTIAANVSIVFSGIQAALLLGFGVYGILRIKRTFHAQLACDRALVLLSLFCASIAVLTTLGIVLSLAFETVRFFQLVAPLDFLFGVNWEPQNSEYGEVGLIASFGAVPVFLGTLLISCIALCFAVPIGLTIAIYSSEYVSKKTRNICKPILEILAGIPTVVYGFFAILIIAPMMRSFGETFGLNIVTESALAAGITMGLMLIPFMSSLSDDVIAAVPKHLRQASLSLGATLSETVIRVVIPAALPGIVASFLLATSRAIGETMIVVMAAGLAAKLTFNPLQSVTTVTVQMVQMLVGDQEFDSAKTLSAFALGITLFLVTLLLNMLSLLVVNKYREKYD